MSAIKSNLERIEEEIKVDNSIESVRNKRSSKRQSINQRYRKSLAFNDKSSSDDDNLESIELNQMWEQLHPSQELAASTTKKYNDSNQLKIKQSRKGKVSLYCGHGNNSLFVCSHNDFNIFHSIFTETEIMLLKRMRLC